MQRLLIVTIRYLADGGGRATRPWFLRDRDGQINRSGYLVRERGEYDLEIKILLVLPARTAILTVVIERPSLLQNSIWLRLVDCPIR
jgi:hypothetical protein